MESLLGEDDNYLEVFQTDMKYSETPLAASISEGLADIYQDLKDFISIYRLGNEPQMLEALYICYENFVSYWGQQLVNVLRALHNIKYSPNDDDAALDCRPSSPPSRTIQPLHRYFRSSTRGRRYFRQTQR